MRPLWLNWMLSTGSNTRSPIHDAAPEQHRRSIRRILRARKNSVRLADRSPIFIR
jgi:hypothetical protein